MAAVTERKSLIPVKETIIVPYNNGATYSTGNTITILFGAGQANTWLVQDSFLLFNYRIALTNATGKTHQNVYIRTLNQIFDWVEVIYQGKQVYIQNFNQQASFIDWLKKGGKYLDYELFSNTTSKNLSYTRLKMGVATAGASTPTESLLIGCLIRVADLFNCFQNVIEMPLNLLDNQIQLNFHIADPRSYLVSATANNNDTDLYNFGNVYDDILVATNSFRIERFELHLKDKVEIMPYSGEGTIKYDYDMNQIALRSIQGSDFGPGMSLNLPFSIVTENVDSMGIYFYPNNAPIVALRPELINVNFKYGNNTSPFSPINVDNYTNPATYKQIINDTWDISTAFFATTNYDFAMSYPYLTYAQGSTNGTPNATRSVGKEDCHIVLATDFVTTSSIMGAPSSEWNSQYIFQANTNGQGMPDCTACMWVKSKYMLFIRGGQLDSVNV